MTYVENVSFIVSAYDFVELAPLEFSRNSYSGFFQSSKFPIVCSLQLRVSIFLVERSLSHKQLTRSGSL